MTQKANPVTNKKAAEPQSVEVDIYDQTYHLRGVDPEHVRALAAVVDTKMRAVASRGTTVDSLRVAVLAALNLADELALLKEGSAVKTASNMANRADALNDLLDQVLAEERAAG